MNRRLQAPPPASIVTGAVEPRRTPTRCPRCRALVRWEGNPDRPFCSPRCRLADLGNWAAERYRMPGDAIREDDEGGDGSPE